MKQTMSGIAYLHSQDIVHRDIKPANILAKSTQNGVVIKLADFGLCKILDDRQTSTMHSNVGTMAFKAPEFWDPQTDERIRYHRNVDVYAAGLTFTAIGQATPGSYYIMTWGVGGGGVPYFTSFFGTSWSPPPT